MDFSSPPAPVLAALADAIEEQLTAVMEVMHFVAKADGFLSADELRQFLRLAKTVSGGSIDSKKLSALVSSWSKRVGVNAHQRLSELSLILGTSELRRATYELAQKMATADGKLEGQELAVLEQIETAFGI